MAFNRLKKILEIDQDYLDCDRCIYTGNNQPRRVEVTNNQYPVGWGRIAGINPNTGMPVVVDLCDLCAPEVVTFIRNNPKQRPGTQT